MSLTTIQLTQDQFYPIEKIFVDDGEIKASLFRFPSGVCAVRLQNGVGELVLLPFQGQQIWSARMGGRELTMKSMFDQPYPTREFLATYGGFLLHCGATAMGVPAAEDTHPLHGELPNAPYPAAQIILGEDPKKGRFIGLTGVYRHTVAFNYNYLAEPVVKLYENQTVFDVSMTVTNLKNTPMPLMYLAHINFRPVDHARLAYSVTCDPLHMRVRADVPTFMQTPPGYREFLAELKEHPEMHLELDPRSAYDPEVVFFLDYLAGADGWARALQILPDRSADVVRHRPQQLPHGLRWICRTADQDALGFEPATAEGTGFASEKRKGYVQTLGPGQQFHCDLEVGTLLPEDAVKEEAEIQTILAGSRR